MHEQSVRGGSGESSAIAIQAFTGAVPFLATAPAETWHQGGTP
jgi:hypothetical protein